MGTHLRPHRLRHHIARTYRHRTARDTRQGTHWYPAARRLVSRWAARYRLPRQTVANVIAAISPQCNWTDNKRLARAILDGQDPASLGGALRLNLRKARAIRDARARDIRLYFPKGPKVQAFAANLAGDDHALTIDRHATSAAHGRPCYDSITSKQYTIIAQAYRDVARALGLPPARLQAVIWITWRRLHGRAVTRRKP